MALAQANQNSLHQATYLGLVFSTTECGVAARSDQGFDAYASVPMEAKATWHGWPAHYLEHVPRMIAAVLSKLRDQGWSFSRPGFLSQAWRQHDLAIVDSDDNPLIPAPSWECNAATEETQLLASKVPALERATGRIEPRFIAAKLPWALRMEPGLRNRIARVMTSGDWVSGKLTGHWRLSSSDALCNGMLDQRTRALATKELRAANRALGGRLNPRWFPDVIGSREAVGTVRVRKDSGWDSVTRDLKGWKVVAGLGDNQSTAAGCGTADHGTIVISLGTSGTINRPCARDAELRGRALSFEFWDDRLLLLMLPACGAWYSQFRNEFEPNRPLRAWNDLASQADLARVRRIRPPSAAGELRDLAVLAQLPPQQQVASVLCSIALEILDRTRLMLKEVVRPARPIDRFVLTGGLARAPLLRQVICEGLKLLVPGCQVLQNDHQGALAFNTDALGAIYNSVMAHTRRELADIVAGDARHRRCEEPRSRRHPGLGAFLVHHGFQ